MKKNVNIYLYIGLQVYIWKDNTSVYDNIKKVLAYKKDETLRDEIPSYVISSIDLLLRKIITYTHRRLNCIYGNLKIKRNIFSEVNIYFI